MQNMSTYLHIFKPKVLWWVLTVSSFAGLAASFVQAIERINYGDNPSQPLQCDINSVFSCSNVFDAWQSSVFGFSNSLMCIVFFAVLVGVGLVAATGGEVNKKLRLILHSFSMFFLAFGAWYLWQSTFVINYICIFCTICYTAVIAMNWAWLRINAKDYFDSKKSYKKWQKIESSGLDTFGWILYTIAFAAMIAFHFWA